MIAPAIGLADGAMPSYTTFAIPTKTRAGVVITGAIPSAPTKARLTAVGPIGAPASI